MHEASKALSPYRKDDWYTRIQDGFLLTYNGRRNVTEAPTDDRQRASTPEPRAPCADARVDDPRELAQVATTLDPPSPMARSPAAPAQSANRSTSPAPTLHSVNNSGTPVTEPAAKLTATAEAQVASSSGLKRARSPDEGGGDEEVPWVRVCSIFVSITAFTC